MKRRDFLKKTVSCSRRRCRRRFDGLLSTPAISQGLKKDGSSFPRGLGTFPGFGTGAQRVAQRIADATDGRISVEYFAAGERVGCI